MSIISVLILHFRSFVEVTKIFNSFQSQAADDNPNTGALLSAMDGALQAALDANSPRPLDIGADWKIFRQSDRAFASFAFFCQASTSCPMIQNGFIYSINIGSFRLSLHIFIGSFHYFHCH